jgi:hypothetical protein
VTNERLNSVEALQIDGDVSVGINHGTEYPWDFVVIRDKDPNGPAFLDLEGARKLRDWLNRALPDEPRAYRLFEPKEAGSSWCKHCNLLRDEHDPGICPAENRPAPHE